MQRPKQHNSARTLLVALCLLNLLGCAGLDRFGERGTRQMQSPATTQQSPQIDTTQNTVTEMPLESLTGQAETPQPAGAPLTSGDGVAVALLLPLSASGQVGELAQAMKNAAELAQSEYKGAKLRLSVKDDLGSAEGARVAARAAQAEGAQVFLGPLLSSSVQAAASVTRSTG